MILIWHTVLHGHFSGQFENKETISQIEGISGVAYKLWYCIDIVVYPILGNLFFGCSGTVILFYKVFRTL